MDVLRTPLLNDNDRRKAFFEAMPELFLGELLNELKHHRYFSYSRIDTLDEYDMFVSRGSFVFERSVYQQTYEEFKSSFDELTSFMEKNLFTENSIVVLDSVLRKKKSEQYKELANDLDTLCYRVADRYKRLVDIFSKDTIKPESKTSVVRSNNTLRYDDKSYVASSNRTKGMLLALWDKNEKVGDIKKASWTSSANVACAMGIIKSSKDYSPDVFTKVNETRKSMNRRLDEIGIKAEIKKNKLDELLFVVTE